MFKAWHKPIDILVMSIQYLKNYNKPIVNATTDEYFLSMQKFFNDLSGVAKTVFIPEMHMDWELEPFQQILQQKLFAKKDLTAFTRLYKVSLINF